MDTATRASGDTPAEGAPADSTQPSAPPTSAPDAAVTLSFGGDVHFEGPLASLAKAQPDRMFGGVKAPLLGADISTINIETAIAVNGSKVAKAFNFKAHPDVLKSLVDQGIDVLGMANNHSLDFGQSGFAETLQAVQRFGSPTIGMGSTATEAFAPRIVERQGAKIAFVGASDVIDANLVSTWAATDQRPGIAYAKNRSAIVAAVRSARTQANTVVVFLHWGTEKQTCPNDSQRELVKLLSDAGADVIVGSHAHRVMGAGYYGSTYVAYGLGNFMFKGPAGEGNVSGVLTMSVQGRSVTQPTWHPAAIGGDFVPRLLTGKAETDAVSKFNQLRACANLSEKPTATGTPPAAASTSNAVPEST